jgi:hypothetical protein
MSKYCRIGHFLSPADHTTGTGCHFDFRQGRRSTANRAHPAASFLEFNLDQIVGGEIRVDDASAAKRINT